MLTRLLGKIAVALIVDYYNTWAKVQTQAQFCLMFVKVSKITAAFFREVDFVLTLSISSYQSQNYQLSKQIYKQNL